MLLRVLAAVTKTILRQQPVAGNKLGEGFEQDMRQEVITGG